MKYTKYIIGILICLMIILSGCSFSTDSMIVGKKETEYIKVGFVAPLTGDASIWGEQLKKGFEYAVEEINTNGGIDGKLIKPIYADDACSSVTGMDSFNKLINLEGVKYITGTVCSNVAMAVINMTQENNVLYIATGATNPDIPKQGDLVFRLWPSNAYDAKAISEYAISKLGLNSFSIAYLNDNPSGIGTANEFIHNLNLANKKLQVTESFSSTEKDYRTIATKLISKNPDAIYIMALPDNMPLIVNQIRELNYKGTILLHGPTAMTQGVIDNIDDKTDLYYATPKQLEETNFWNNYEAKTGEKADLLIAGGYDSMDIIADSLKECGENNSCIRDYLINLECYQSTRGKFSFDSNGDLNEVPYEVIKVN